MNTTIDLNNYPHPILLYDGVCNLCNEAVQFVIQRDKKGIVHYAALQSEVGQKLLEKHKLVNDLDTVVLVEGGKAYTHAEVTIRLGQLLGGIYTSANLLRIFPLSVRKIGYNWVATNRYRWFGKQESCMMPTADIKSRFLDF